MTIRTKFTVGDTVYFLYNNAITSGVIKECSISIGGNKDQLRIREAYHVIGDDAINASSLFSSLEDLLKNLKYDYEAKKGGR